ncbi:MAG: hypothetical protein HGA86_02530, partial [Anaerolineaceae bacterium]|nr:hypothetical protein [Anaerolineaceae bacterium]
MDNTTLQEILKKEQETLAKYRHVIHVCAGTGCISSNSPTIIAALEKEVKARGLENEVLIKQVGCMGLCAAGPVVSIKPDGILYKSVSPDDAAEILNSLGSQPVERLVIDTTTPFFTRQHKVTLKHSGEVNPEKIEDYIAQGGYLGAIKAITAMDQQAVINEIKSSGLRGRGGGGFSTGAKWQMVADTVKNELALGPNILRWPPQATASFVENGLAWTKLDPDTCPLDLHPAQARMLEIAACNTNASVVILDEPTVGLDSVGIQTVMSLVSTLLAQGKGVVIITHDLGVVAETVDRVVVMYGGRVMEEG